MDQLSIAATGCLLALLSVATPASGASEADAQAIRMVALDYIEGWYSGDADRMAAALHPQLAKRIVLRRSGSDVLDEMTAADLIEATGRGEGRTTPPDQQRTDVRVLDVYANTASVRVDAGDWIDYMQLARWDGQWKIVNVLWELRPAAD
jgi:hypothetical protein